jgi:hypothetical protein
MVTVTNHAIDSLMEGMLDAGVAARPGQMIRVGGRSKSERLQPYNLREVITIIISRGRSELAGRVAQHYRNLLAKLV